MSCNLLLVDDEPRVTQSLRRELRKQNCDIFIANSGDEALSLLKNNEIDIVISDHRMPGMTGAELMARVRQGYPHTLRMMLSGQADMKSVINAINEGSIYKFIEKPWVSSDLSVIVEQAIETVLNTRTDTVTGWLTEEVFTKRAARINSDRPLRIMVGEIQDGSSIWGILDSKQRRTFAQLLEQRCAEEVEMLLPLAMLDGGLIGLLCPAGIEDSTMKNLSRAFSQPLEVDGQLHALNITLGYAESSAIELEHADCVELIRHATIALRAISHRSEKRYGGYTSETSKHLQLREQLDRDMLSALDKEQFFLEIQPQVRLDTMRIEGGEALVRWKHDEFGLVSPVNFIDLAEKTDSLTKSDSGWFSRV